MYYFVISTRIQLSETMMAATGGSKSIQCHPRSTGGAPTCVRWWLCNVNLPTSELYHRDWKYSKTTMYFSYWHKLRILSFHKTNTNSPIENYTRYFTLSSKTFSSSLIITRTPRCKETLTQSFFNAHMKHFYIKLLKKFHGSIYTYLICEQICRDNHSS